jgi:hypothetical protein
MNRSQEKNPVLLTLHLPHRDTVIAGIGTGYRAKKAS